MIRRSFRPLGIPKIYCFFRRKWLFTSFKMITREIKISKNHSTRSRISYYNKLSKLKFVKVSFSTTTLLQTQKCATKLFYSKMNFKNPWPLLYIVIHILNGCSTTSTHRYYKRALSRLCLCDNHKLGYCGRLYESFNYSFL